MRRQLFAAVFTFALITPAIAQDPPPGIALRGTYTASERPGVAVRPFGGVGTTPALLDSMTAIVRRDLGFSDRFDMVTTPSTLASGAVDYRAWNGLRAWYLVTGDVVPTAAGYELTLTLHDVVYSRIKETTRYRVPPMSAADFRMTLHAIADGVTKSISNQDGAAATRVALVRQNKTTTANGIGSYDILIVDSDGFGMRRVSGATGQIYSPAWSPDGRKLAYTLGTAAGQQVVERELASGSTRVISSAPLSTTPTYSPDGTRIAFSAWSGNNAEIFEYNAARNCCLKRLTTSRGDDQSPSFSPDGAQITFVSSATGAPHIYVMSASGASPQLITPYIPGANGYYFGPEWSPTSTEIVFAGHWNSRGTYQIMLADARRAGSQIRQLTTGGDNEDPSWSPDGRHIVYSSGVGDQQLSLYVIDTVTESKRRLLDGGSAKLRLSDWSPVLARATDYVVR